MISNGLLNLLPQFRLAAMPACAALSLLVSACNLQTPQQDDAPRGDEVELSDDGAGAEPAASDVPLPKYPFMGASENLLEENLVSFNLRLAGKPDPQALRDYGRCVAARYGIEHGFQFARHVRSVIGRGGRGGIGFIFSQDVPAGIRTIELDGTLGDCRDRQISLR